MPFGFWSVWDETRRAGFWGQCRVFIAFRLLVCLGQVRHEVLVCLACGRSSLPFGFWSVWDWGLTGEKQTDDKIVFIAFRLLVCLGQLAEERGQASAYASSLPFGFWSVWDPCGEMLPRSNTGMSSLPFGFWSVWDRWLMGSVWESPIRSSLPFGFWSVWDARERAAERERIVASSLPFGFWSVWDANESFDAICAVVVFIAFRLLVCLGRFDSRAKTAQTVLSSLPFGFWSVWDSCASAQLRP